MGLLPACRWASDQRLTSDYKRQATSALQARTTSGKPPAGGRSTMVGDPWNRGANIRSAGGRRLLRGCCPACCRLSVACCLPGQKGDNRLLRTRWGLFRRGQQATDRRRPPPEKPPAFRPQTLTLIAPLPGMAARTPARRAVPSSLPSAQHRQACGRKTWACGAVDEADPKSTAAQPKRAAADADGGAVDPKSTAAQPKRAAADADGGAVDPKSTATQPKRAAADVESATVDVRERWRRQLVRPKAAVLRPRARMLSGRHATAGEPLWNPRGRPTVTNDDRRQPGERWSGRVSTRLTRCEKRAVETQGKKK
ncbi:Uncharacterised protein [Streptomyces griseus]|uniref:Uncharacterized protein n=1 Tax=Streptomyces griseus TaxID=1911 RepID=A0A380MKS2_STRGR|nr:Uncharacterised protein [Streptomyces griseus]